MSAVPAAGLGAVVVTGASSGIGLACALHLDRRGFRVFATALPGEERGGMLASASARLTLLELDITDPASIARVATAVQESLGGAGLAGLVNNAGVNIGIGPLEFLPIALLRRQLEVNVIGQVAVTQAFLPLLRAGNGRIVMMGSAAGRMVYPFLGPYSASKAALQALTSALRVELLPWGIPVSIVIPGAIATPIWEKSVHTLDEVVQTLPPEAHTRYDRALAAMRQFRQRTGKAGSPVERVAATVEEALTSSRPRTRYLVGHFARGAGLLSYLPDRAIDRLIVRGMRLPKQAA